ncbi:hypothetical protein Tco_0772696 [Tanacetum coccineum]|uniref:Gag-Pol polyprotein n=1 Tax=Tanacetum coccineum TaxID=301880 RepID=A0ABQ4ZIT3_9ASTR
MCMFALTVSIVEPKNIKEAMADSAWIEAMQEELHQFDRLQVWELVDKPFGKNVIKLKWLWKNKKDEDQTDFRSTNPHGGNLSIRQSTLRDSGKKHVLKKTKHLVHQEATKPKLDADLSGEPVDQTDYRSKIGSLMYLTSSRPDIVQAVCYCVRYQARSTEKHLKQVKRIFRYLRGPFQPGTLYPMGLLELTTFSMPIMPESPYTPQKILLKEYNS